MKRARHKKEKPVEAQATSAEQHHTEGESGDGVQPSVIEEPAPADSREGEKRFLPKENFLTPWMLCHAKYHFDIFQNLFLPSHKLM